MKDNMEQNGLTYQILFIEAPYDDQTGGGYVYGNITWNNRTDD
jgi:hypothetical protein